jgi:NuA3 HAT complex component NTO1
MRYNKPGTLYYKAAQRIESSSATVLAELSNLRTSAPLELANNKMMVNSLVQPSISTIGDLEPPLALLDLLVSPDIADELNIVFHTDPLQFLLAYKLPEFKPPPMAPVHPTPSSRKAKRERKAQLAKRLAEQQADSEIVMSGSPAPAPFPAMFAAAADTDPVATTTVAMAIAISGLEVKSEVEQVLGKRKRTKIATPHPGTDAEVLTDINPKASFKLFDKGWILDPGVRRGGRARMERIPPPLTKKRPKGTCVDRNRVVYNEETKCSCIGSSHEGSKCRNASL